MNQEKEYEFTEQNCLDDFKEAKLRLINKPHNAFIGSLLYDLAFEPSREVKSVMLDSMNHSIKINPDFFCGMTHEQQASVLAHEVYHYALMHDVRRGHRNPQLYQKAADQVVNNLLEQGGFELPMGVECDSKYRNMSTEHVYNLMEHEQKNNNNQDQDQNQNNSNDPLGNDLPPNSGNGGSGNNNQINRMQQNIMKANASEELTNGHGMAHGNSGSVFEQLFKDIKEGKLSWIEILQEFLDDFVQGEQDWSNFNRRYLQYDLFLPDYKSENKISKVAVAFDVSGSVTKAQIKAFLNEMKVIKNQLDPETMDVVSFNHAIVDIFKIESNDDFDEVKMNIDGGTDLDPVFDHYMKPENQPEFLIVFSDLYCDKRKKKTPFETIWICIDHPDAQVSFGKLIHITSEELES